MIVKSTVNELLDHAENRFALVIAASKRAREIASQAKANNSDVEIDLGSAATQSAVPETPKSNPQAQAGIDLQKELERKFDELFGTSNNKPQE